METPTLDIDFNVSELFKYTQIIVSAMMPVIYITLGISLGFMITRALKNAVA